MRQLSELILEQYRDYYSLIKFNMFNYLDLELTTIERNKRINIRKSLKKQTQKK